MFCSKCGAQNADGARFCERCGDTLGGGAQPGYAPPPPNPPYAAGPVPPPPPYQAPLGPGQYYAVGKEPLLAVLMSFFLPGLGQFYNGDTKKGAMMLGILLVSLILISIVIGIAGVFGVWIWSMIDAYNVASAKAPIKR